jgi:CTP synthase (UTP-ammonia lyase)
VVRARQSYRSLAGALAGIRFACEHGLPFLGTCAGFQHGVIEIARHDPMSSPNRSAHWSGRQ